MQLLRVLLAVVVLGLCSVIAAEAGTVKGTLYNTNGTINTSGTVAVKVYVVNKTDGSKGAMVSSVISSVDGSYVANFDSTKLILGDHVMAEYTSKSGNVTTVQGANAAFTGGLLASPAVAHTVHVIVP